MDALLNHHNSLLPHAVVHRPAGERQDRRDEEVALKLAASGYPSLRRVRCQSHDDVTVLSGTVPSYYLKQVAQTVAGKTAGVGQIENRLEVRTVR